MMDDTVRNGILTGFQIHVRQLKPSDVDTWKIDLGTAAIEDCVAIEGEVVGQYLAAVIHLQDTANPYTYGNKTADTIWIDNGLSAGIVPDMLIADAVAKLLVEFMPHLHEE